MGQQAGSDHGLSRAPKKIAAANFHNIGSLKRVRCNQGSHDPVRKRQQTLYNFNPLHAPFEAGFKTQQAAFAYLDKQSCSKILR
jgi:hypothetical protein